MKAEILVFAPDMEKAAALAREITALDLPARAVEPKQYGRPLGVLAGENLLGFPGGLNTPPAEPVLVLCHMGEAELDDTLAKLRQSGLGAGILKAILTPTNRFWTVSILEEELRKEREMMKNRRK